MILWHLIWPKSFKTWTLVVRQNRLCFEEILRKPRSSMLVTLSPWTIKARKQIDWNGKFQKKKTKWKFCIFFLVWCAFCRLIHSKLPWLETDCAETVGYSHPLQMFLICKFQSEIWYYNKSLMYVHWKIFLYHGLT